MGESQKSCCGFLTLSHLFYTYTANYELDINKFATFSR